MTEPRRESRTEAHTVSLPDPEATRGLGRRIASCLEAGDLVVLVGGLGAGKTTLTQGLGAALGVRGPITSPTFVIARTHPSLIGGLDLVHVDAYRVGGTTEIDDLDLGSSDAVTVVEWGAGLVEHLADSWLTVELAVAPIGGSTHGPDADEMRRATLIGHGPRWSDAALERIVGPPDRRA